MKQHFTHMSTSFMGLTMIFKLTALSALLPLNTLRIWYWMNPLLVREFWYENLLISYIQIIMPKFSFAIMRSLLRAKKVSECIENWTVHFSVFSLQAQQNHREKKFLVKNGDSRIHPKLLVCSVLSGAQESRHHANTQRDPSHQLILQRTAVRWWWFPALNVYFLKRHFY